MQRRVVVVVVGVGGGLGWGGEGVAAQVKPPASLSPPLGGAPGVCYNRKRLKVNAQAYCLPACVTDACLSLFPVRVSGSRG